MDCTDIERILLDGEVPGPDARAHLAACESCRFLTEESSDVPSALAGLSLGPLVAPDLRGLEAAVARDRADERGPVAALRATPRWLRALLLGVVMGGFALFVVSFVLRADIGTYAPARLIAQLSAYALLAGVAAWMALRPVYAPPPAPAVARVLVWLALLTPIAIALLPELPTRAAAAAAYVRFGYEMYCFTYGGMMGVAVLFVARFLDRGDHRSTEHALLAALAGGMTGVLALQLECPINFPGHLLTGHAVIPIALYFGYRALLRSH
jgi:hypothetical protein